MTRQRRCPAVAMRPGAEHSRLSRAAQQLRASSGCTLGAHTRHAEVTASRTRTLTSQPTSQLRARGEERPVEVGVQPCRGAALRLCPRRAAFTRPPPTARTSRCRAVAAVWRGRRGGGRGGGPADADELLHIVPQPRTGGCLGRGRRARRRLPVPPRTASTPAPRQLLLPPPRRGPAPRLGRRRRRRWRRQRRRRRGLTTQGTGRPGLRRRPASAPGRVATPPAAKAGSTARLRTRVRDEGSV